MKKVIYLFVILFIFGACGKEKQMTEDINSRFIHIQGQDLIASDGSKFFIQGINLGNWLNPEGYMFYFGNVSSYRLINDAFCEMVGADFTGWFWKEFRKNYITKEDIAYIKKTGMNTIRIPFHYKLFTDEYYMGTAGAQNGFEIMDALLNWCRDEGIYVILDMHDAPGGQTGDNIDDSYGYPWLYKSEESQVLCCNIWKNIAERYANDTIILGYDLLNEPVAHYYPELNNELEPFYKRCIAAIREVDNNHIVMLGGAQWNSNFNVFTDWNFDDKLMYTCHRYWCDTLQNNIQDFVDFRNKVNLPLFMGETGENTDEWVGAWRRLMENNNIGWTYWPYKKMAKGACMMIVPEPENWNIIVEYTKKDRSSFAKIREARPNQEIVKQAMKDLLENIKFTNSQKNSGYTENLGMQP